MSTTTDQTTLREQAARTAKEWMPILAKYRQPAFWRSIWELGVTFVPFVILWVLACWSTKVSYWLTLGIAVAAAFFLVRLFTIQHDCGHGAFFKNKHLNDWVGRVIGVLTLTPYTVWRKAHSLHHSSSGNLDGRGIGAIHTLTVEEYNAKGFWGRFGYRVFRNPLILFVIGPAYVFLLQNRLPVEFMKSWRHWRSAMGTNFGIFAAAGVLIYFIGFATFFKVFLPIMVVAATIGVWLFYVQHQFEDTHWSKGDEWEMQNAALFGSSHYVLPKFLQWMTANIGIHHIHHLNSRIPFYRLPQVLKDNPVLADIKRLSLWKSFSCINLHLWCEQRQKLVSFAEAKMLGAASA